MKALILAIRKLITVFIAVLIPTSSATPAIVHIENVSDESSVVSSVSNDTYEEFEIVDDRDYTSGATEENNNEEGETPDEMTEDDATQYTAIQSWDVSATENDSVTMSFYNTDDVEGLLEQLAGRITALFTPLTAYASEGDERTVDDSDEATIITEGDSVIIINKEGLATAVDDEFGNGGDGEYEEPESLAGTVIVTGRGDMMDYVYNYFVSVDKYVNTMKALLEEYYGEEITPIYDSSVTDVVELDALIQWKKTATGEYVIVDDFIKNQLNASEVLLYSPKTIIIDNGVTNISDYAFAFCGEIDGVIMPNTVTEIGNGAFAYCENLASIQLSANLTKIGESAFLNCTKLDNVVIPSTVKSIGYSAFENIAVGSIITVPTTAIKKMFNSWVYTKGRTTIVLAS